MMLYRLIKGTDREKFQPSVISLTGDGTVSNLIRGLHIAVRSVNMQPGVPDLGAMFRVRDLLKSLEPDIIQTWMYHADLVGGVSAKLAGLGPVVWGMHHSSLSHEGLKSTTRWVARASALLSGHVPERIVCCSEATKVAHAKFGYARNKMEVITNGFDVRDYPEGEERAKDRAAVREELGIKGDDIVFGTVGRYHPVKDIPGMLAAFGEACKGTSARLVLIGHGLTNANQELTSQIEGAGLKDQLILLGERDDVPRLLAGLDVFINSSYSEAFSNAIGEAMLSSLPCVVTSVGDSAWMVGDSGRTVPAANSQELATALSSLYSMRQADRERMGALARKRAVAEFSIESSVNRYQELYARVIDGHEDSISS